MSLRSPWPMTSTRSPRGAWIASKGKAGFEQQLALLFDDRLPGFARATEEDQRLGRSGQTGRQNHHDPIRRPAAARALELSRRLGLAVRKLGGRRRPRIIWSSCSATVPVLDSGARAFDHHLRPARPRRRPARLENEAFLAVNELGKGKFDSGAVHLDPGRTARHDCRQDRRRRRLSQRSRRPISDSSTTPEAPGDHRPQYYRPRNPAGGGPSTKAGSRTCSC